MKKVLIIAIALATISATAQETKKEAHSDAKMERAEMRKNMTPEETAQLQTKKMTLKLDLDEKQQAQVETILLTEAKERKEKMETYKTAKEKSGGEKLSKDERLKMQNERLDHQIELKKKMKAILNADQYQKLEKMQEERQTKKYKMTKSKD